MSRGDDKRAERAGLRDEAAGNVLVCLGCKQPRGKSRFRMLDDESLPRRLRHRCQDCMRNQPNSKALLKPDGTKARRRALKKVRRESIGRRAASAARKRAERQATPRWVDKGAIDAVYHEVARLTQETGIVHHVDHEVPLRGVFVCGLHVPWNLRPMPGEENVKKSNRYEVAA